jgi:hypothetical protein
MIGELALPRTVPGGKYSRSQPFFEFFMDRFMYSSYWPNR